MEKDIQERIIFLRNEERQLRQEADMLRQTLKGLEQKKGKEERQGYMMQAIKDYRDIFGKSLETFFVNTLMENIERKEMEIQEIDVKNGDTIYD